MLFPFFHWTKQTQNPHHADQIPGRSTVPTVSAWSIFDSPQLVGGFNPSEKYESQIRSSSQLLGKKHMFQTTNQTKNTCWLAGYIKNMKIIMKIIMKITNGWNHQPGWLCSINIAQKLKDLIATSSRLAMKLMIVGVGVVDDKTWGLSIKYKGFMRLWFN